MNKNYLKGFLRKCAEAEVSPEDIIEIINAEAKVSGPGGNISNQTGPYAQGLVDTPGVGMGGSPNRRGLGTQSTQGTPNQTGPYAQGLAGPGMGMGEPKNKMGGQQFTLIDLLNNLPPEQQKRIVEILEAQYAKQPTIKSAEEIQKVEKKTGSNFDRDKVPYDGKKKKNKKGKRERFSKGNSGYLKKDNYAQDSEDKKKKKREEDKKKREAKVEAAAKKLGIKKACDSKTFRKGFFKKCASFKLTPDQAVQVFLDFEKEALEVPSFLKNMNPGVVGALAGGALGYGGSYLLEDEDKKMTQAERLALAAAFGATGYGVGSLAGGNKAEGAVKPPVDPGKKPPVDPGKKPPVDPGKKPPGETLGEYAAQIKAKQTKAKALVSFKAKLRDITKARVKAKAKAEAKAEAQAQQANALAEGRSLAKAQYKALTEREQAKAQAEAKAEAEQKISNHTQKMFNLARLPSEGFTPPVDPGKKPPVDPGKKSPAKALVSFKAKLRDIAKARAQAKAEEE